MLGVLAIVLFFLVKVDGDNIYDSDHGNRYQYLFIYNNDYKDIIQIEANRG